MLKKFHIQTKNYYGNHLGKHYHYHSNHLYDKILSREDSMCRREEPPGTDHTDGPCRRTLRNRRTLDLLNDTSLSLWTLVGRRSNFSQPSRDSKQFCVLGWFSRIEQGVGHRDLR